MEFFRKLERKYGRYAIHNLMYYIIILYGIGMVIQWVDPMFYIRYLSLDASAILRGQIWRIVTFVIWPPSTDIFFNLLSMYLYYWLGTNLERVWGAFRFNVYFLMGILGHFLAALVGYLVFGQGWFLTTSYLNFSLFFAFAATFPDLQFYLFFVIPIKAKWLALFDGIYFLYGFAFGNAATRCAILLSFLNFIIFFFMTRDFRRVSPKEIKRKQEFKTKMRAAEHVKEQGSHHRCAVCGRTEKDDPTLEFRYCSKCEGEYEYCMDHLYTHRHVTKDDN